MNEIYKSLAIRRMLLSFPATKCENIDVKMRRVANKERRNSKEDRASQGNAAVQYARKKTFAMSVPV